MTEEQPPLIPGMQIRNYILEEQLGKGASGEVWKANDGTKTVALKLMNPQLLTSRNVSKHFTRLQREIEALQRLQNHPNIPSIFDYDLEYERPYLAMQFIGGLSYDRLIKSGDILRIPLAHRLNIVRDLAMALYAAHREGIIHRDIKPANVSGTENPYLLDFSVALPEADLQKTQANIGTKLYMPWDGIPDKQGDVYSFALLVYEILFGRHAIFRPEDGPTLKATPFMPQMMAADRIKKREWLVPSSVPLEELPADLLGKDLRALDAVFQKALDNRAQRYEDPRDFAADLRQAVEQGTAPEAVPQQAAPPPTPEPDATEADHLSTQVQNHEATYIAPPEPDNAPTVLEDPNVLSSTPVTPYTGPQADQPTVIENQEAAPAQPAPDAPDENIYDGATVIETPAKPPVPAGETPTPPATPPAPPHRPLPPSLEPERPVPAPPMPDSQPDLYAPTQFEPEESERRRSPLIFIVAGVVVIAIIAAVLLLNNNAGAGGIETLTPDGTASDAAADGAATLVIAEATEEVTETALPPTATRQPTDTPIPATETPAPPTQTPLPSSTPTDIPTDTPAPPTATLTHTATSTPIPPTATRRPTNTPVPATNTPLPTDTPPPPSSTPTDIPTSTPSPIPPTATRRPTQGAAQTQAIPTAEPLSEDLAENIRVLQQAINAESYDCGVFNAVYTHLEDHASSSDLAYQRYGDDILRRMTPIYEDYCRSQTGANQPLPAQHAPASSDLDLLLNVILRVLEITRTPSSAG